MANTRGLTQIMNQFENKIHWCC